MLRKVKNSATTGNPVTGRLSVIVSAVVLLGGCIGIVPSVAAEDCWTDVTVSEPCGPKDWIQLQFKNSCTGGPHSVQVCVRWLTGPNAGVLNRLGSYANGGEVAVVTPGMCVGKIRYNYNRDGSTPDCPDDSTP